jgi:hypothetical protein
MSWARTAACLVVVERDKDVAAAEVGGLLPSQLMGAFIR